MSQRGGSVSSDVRYGVQVFSPMVPPGEGDFLLATAADQVPVNAAVLRQGGTIIDPSYIDQSKLRNQKSLNVALLGVLSRHLQFSEQEWLAAIRRILPEALHEANVQAFHIGRGDSSA
jgi:indolepyruvate ferredoxin oxidoreductase beta subunit